MDFFKEEEDDLNNYELTLILNPAIEEEGINKLLERIGIILDKGKGNIIGIDKWGLRKLAYSIKDQEEGYYVVLKILAPPTLVAELDKELKLLSDVLRFMFIAIKEVSKEGGD